MHTVPEIAAIFRVTEKTVLTWVRYGMPVVKEGGQGRGRKTLLDLRACVAWFFEQNFERLELMRAQTRLAAALAVRVQCENRLRAENLADISVIAAVADDLANHASRELLGLARPLALAIEGLDARGREGVIDRAVRAKLEELAVYRPGRKGAKANP